MCSFQTIHMQSLLLLNSWRNLTGKEKFCWTFSRLLWVWDYQQSVIRHRWESSQCFNSYRAHSFLCRGCYSRDYFSILPSGCILHSVIGNNGKRWHENEWERKNDNWNRKHAAFTIRIHICMHQSLTKQTYTTYTLTRRCCTKTPQNANKSHDNVTNNNAAHESYVDSTL